MSFFDLLSTSFTNLYQRKARTLLTVLGVVIGTMSIVLMIALGEGSAQTFLEEVSQSSDLTKIEVYQNYSPSNKPEDALSDKTVEAFKQIKNVKAVVPYTNVPIYIESPRYASEMYLNAVPINSVRELYSDKLEWGAFSGGNECRVYIGKSLAETCIYKRIAGKELWEMQLAQSPDLENEKFTVRIGSYFNYENNEQEMQSMIPPKGKDGRIGGVFAETGGELDYSGFIDIEIIKRFVKENKQFAEYCGISSDYSVIQVYADDMINVETILNTIKDAGYQAYSPMEYIKQMQDESRRQQAQWGAVGAIALIVSAIGIINTMMTSIMERKREIGVLKVLGCSLGNISAMFLVEAAVIGMLGGIIGVALSYAVSLITTAIPIASDGTTILGSFFGSNVRFVITPLTAVAAVAGAAVIGMAAGIYPSVRAMKMPALAALRDE